MIELFTATAPYIPPKIAFSIGTFSVAWYGIFIFIGFLLAIIFASVKLSKWYKVSYDPFFYFTLIGIPVSILGARLWSFIIGDASVPINSNFFIAFWDFQSGGMAIQGGVLFTVIAALIWFPLILKKPKYQVKTKIGNDFFVKQVSMWVYADAIIPCILIGQIIGRWGNFFNQEVYGDLVVDPEVSMAWLKTVMPDVYYGMFIDGNPNNFHQPLFLYESFFNFWIFIFLFIGCEFIKFRKAGDIAILYFVLYGILRLTMEPLRSSNFFFVTSIVTSSLYLGIGLLILILNHFLFVKIRSQKVFYRIYVVFRFNWLKFASHFSKDIAYKLQNVDPNFDKYGMMKKPNFIREDVEMLYYNGY